MEVLLLRHSSTQGNLERRYVGSQDHPLAQVGIDLANDRKDQLPVPEALWVSPMLRCRQTADILFPDMEQNIKDTLRECDFGDFEGKTWEELKDNPIYIAWMDGDPDVVFPNGEGLGDQLQRCQKAVTEVIHQAMAEKRGRICILAHGGTLMSVMSKFCVPHHDFYHWLPKNCGGFLVNVDDVKGKSITFDLIDVI